MSTSPLRTRSHSSRSRLTAGLGAVAVTVGVLVAPPAAAAQVGPRVVGTAAGTAAGWLTEQYTAGTHLQTDSGGTFYDDPGLTADGILALDAAHVGQTFAATATSWLAAHVGSYVGDGNSESYAGALAKAALTAQAQGLNPKLFGGRNLLADLAARQVATGGANPGRYSDKSQYGDFSNAITQSFAILALTRADNLVPGGPKNPQLPAATTSLNSLRCDKAGEDGGFRLAYADPKAPQGTCVSDPDATAVAIQALALKADDPALNYLQRQQQADGGLEATQGPENANTTGLAAVAFGLAGLQGAAAKAAGYLRARQAEAKAPTAVGAVNFTKGAYDANTSLRATSQALLGLVVGDDIEKGPRAAGYLTVSRSGAAPGAPTTAVPRGSFSTITPARLLDTRRSVALPAGSSVDVVVAGKSGIPADVFAVSANLTAVTPTSPGYVVAYPAGSPIPATSNLNLIPGSTVAAGAQLAVGKAGRITLTNRSPKPVNLLFDVTGYYRAGAGLAAGTIRGVKPTRLFDTRVTKAVPAGGSVDVQVLGAGPVPPADVAAAAVTVTAVLPRSPGFVTAFPAGVARNSSTLNLVPGRTVANGAVVKLGTGGKITLFNGSTKPLDLLLDVTGVYLGGTARFPGTFTAITPARLLDTRTAGGPLTPGSARTVPVAGRGGVPASGAAAALYNLTAVDPTAPGYVVATANGQRPTGTSTVNLTPKVTVANLATTGLGTNGAIALTLGSGAPLNAIVDVSGWFRR